jgi:hypothetical protein
VRLGTIVLLGALAAGPAAAQRIPDRAPVSPRLLRGISPTTLLRGLGEIDFEATRSKLNHYRVVQAEQVLTTEGVQTLARMVDDDSVARRNRDLLTDVLRKSDTIGDDEQVAGIGLANRLIFVIRDGSPGREPARGGAPVAQRVMEADATVLARDLAMVAFEQLQPELYRYRIAQAQEVLSPGKRRLLADAIDKDSQARRNRDLLTAHLRRTGMIPNAQQVIGISAQRRIIFVR